jgi:hypothetical protein
MHPDVGTLAQVAVLVVVTCGSLATIAVLAFRAMARTRRLPPPTAQHEDRLEHLQQSVDAIAIEVERIAEGQRFTTKLLSERGEGSDLGR